MGFPTGISGARPHLPRPGPGDEIRHALRHAARGARSGAASTTASARRSTTATRCARARSWSPPGCNIAACPSRASSEFEGAGIYYAATEMEARFCRETEAVVVGGGNRRARRRCICRASPTTCTSLCAAPDLASSMSAYLRSRLEADPRITIHYHCPARGLEGRQASVRRDPHRPRRERRADDRRLGAVPDDRRAAQHGWLSGLVDLDESGFVEDRHARPGLRATSKPLAPASSPSATSRRARSSGLPPPSAKARWSSVRSGRYLRPDRSTLRRSSSRSEQRMPVCSASLSNPAATGLVTARSLTRRIADGEATMKISDVMTKHIQKPSRRPIPVSEAAGFMLSGGHRLDPGVR